MSDQEPKPVAAYKTSLQTRNFEIDLFWKRALFFWGFIAAAFVAYATLKKDDSDLALPVACFGMICSFAWTLANRGSKYWQENWEKKVEKFEKDVTGPLFVDREERQKKGLWGAQHYSVSKLAIALSDFTFAFWVGTTAVESHALFYDQPLFGWPKNGLLLVVPVFSVVYLIIMLCAGRTQPGTTTTPSQPTAHATAPELPKPPHETDLLPGKDTTLARPALGSQTARDH